MLEENYLYYYNREDKTFVTPALQIALNRNSEGVIRAKNSEGKYINISTEE